MWGRNDQKRERETSETSTRVTVLEMGALSYGAERGSDEAKGRENWTMCCRLRLVSWSAGRENETTYFVQSNHPRL